jgi:hypothetical protein
LRAARGAGECVALIAAVAVDPSLVEQELRTATGRRRVRPPLQIDETPL